MDSRKVQMTGGSSLMITLPKEWTEAAGIKKNDTLNLFPQTGGDLLISTSKGQSKALAVKRINVDDINDPDLLFRILVGVYISGYKMVEIFSSDRIRGRLRDAAEDMTQTAIGIEIIEEYDDRLILKDLVDPCEMRMDRTADRMRSLVQNMLADVMVAIANSDVASLDDIADRDNDVDRLEWLVMRQTNMAHDDPVICRKIGMSQKGMVMYYVLCRMIERVGDHVVTISKNAKILLENAPDKELINEIVAIGTRLNLTFAGTMKAWTEKNIESANSMIKACEEIVTKSRRVNIRALDEKFDPALSAAMIAGSLRRISEYIMDIAEQAINLSV
jgi:phosphate uptake regulator